MTQGVGSARRPVLEGEQEKPTRRFLPVSSFEELLACGLLVVAHPPRDADDPFDAAQFERRFFGDYDPGLRGDREHVAYLGVVAVAVADLVWAV